MPEPDEVDLRHLTSTVLPAGTPLRRGHKSRYPADKPVPAAGTVPPPTEMTRFAPVAGAAHAYVARREIAALLESALHDLVPGAPRIRWPHLAHWSVAHVTLRTDVRLIDLRDPGLAALGIDRAELVATDPGHYPCTRAWAERLHGRHIGGRATHGLLWHSRQAELHADQGIRPLLADILTGEQAEVAVLWPFEAGTILDVAEGPWPLDGGHGLELVRDIATLLGAPPPLTGPGTH